MWPVLQPSPGEVILDPFHPINQGLVGWWLFNEKGGTTLHDYSGFGNHGILTNMSPATAWVVGRNPAITGHVLDFDGVSNYVSIDGLITKLANDTQGTISLWANIDSGNSVHNAFFTISRDGSSVRTEIFMAFDMRSGHHHVNTGLTQDGTDQWIKRTPINSLDEHVGKWVYVTLVQDGVTPLVYFNGISQDLSHNPISTDITLWMKAILTDATSKSDTANLGVIELNGSDFLPLNGKIDNVRILNRAWNINEVIESYFNPFIGILRRRVTDFVPIAAGTILPQIISSYYRINA